MSDGGGRGLPLWDSQLAGILWRLQVGSLCGTRNGRVTGSLRWELIGGAHTVRGMHDACTMHALPNIENGLDCYQPPSSLRGRTPMAYTPRYVRQQHFTQEGQERQGQVLMPRMDGRERAVAGSGLAESLMVLT